MRAIAFTTARGVARVLTRPRLTASPPVVRRTQAALGDFPRAPRALSLSHITTPLDRFAEVATLAATTAEDPFYSSTTISPMQSAAAMVVGA